MTLIRKITLYSVCTAAECWTVTGRKKESFCFPSVIICILLFHTENNTTPPHAGVDGRATLV